MAVALTYLPVALRLGITVGDSSDDPDADPDTIWCDEGKVTLKPRIKDAVAKETDVSVLLGQAELTGMIRSDGWVVWDHALATVVTGVPCIKVVDLTSDAIQPYITSGATHDFTIVGAKARGTKVEFSRGNQPVRLSPAQIDPTIGVINLADQVVASPPTIVQVVTGPKGDQGDTGATGPQGPPGGVNKVAGLQGEPTAQQLVDAIADPLSAQVRAFDPNDLGHALLVLAGQSNMQGAGLGGDLMVDLTHPRVLQYPIKAGDSYYRRPIQGVDPLRHQAYNGLSQGVGPGMNAARIIAESLPPSIKLTLLPCALGSTGFEPTSYIEPGVTYSWDPDNSTVNRNLFWESVAHTQAALADVNLPNARVIGMLWHQGENDANALDQSQYAVKFDRMVAVWRGIFGAELPVVLGQMVPEGIRQHPTRPRINRAHVDTPRRLLRTAFALGPDSSGTYRTDDVAQGAAPVHYNASGARRLGVDMGTAFVRDAVANVPGKPAPVYGRVSFAQAGSAVTATITRTPGRVTATHWQYQINDAAWVDIEDTSLDVARTVTNLPQPSQLSIRVRTENEQGLSGWSEVQTYQVVTAPGVPEGLTAGTPQAGSVPLTWTPTSGATSYRLGYKPSSSSTWSFITTAGPAGSVTGLSPSTAYDFRVSAIGPGGESATSSVVTATTATPAYLASQTGVTPAASYGLRKLISSYSGPAIRVRRSTDNLETDIGFLADSGLDTSALLAHVGTGSGYVTKMYDQGGTSARDLIQSTLALQPPIVESGSVVTKNGNPAMRLNGSAGYRLASGSPFMFAAGAISTLGVYTAPSGPLTETFLFGEFNSSGSSAYIPADWTSSSAPRFAITDQEPSYTPVTGTAVTNDGGLHQISTTDSGSVISIFVDANANASGTYSRSGRTFTLNAIGLGTGTGNTAFLACEMAVFTTVLTQSQRQAGEANQKAWHGTP